MSQLEIVLTAWFAFHSQLGVDVESSLAPAASEAEIQAVESKIGFRLPDDLRSLYKIANGQLDPFDQESELSKRLAPGDYWAPLFGNHMFMSLQQALTEYEFLLDMYNEEREFSKKYNEANPDDTIEPYLWDIRAGDPVDPSGWNPMWFPFANTNADSYSVDLSPVQGGTSGQVIEHGPDVAKLSVVAESIIDLLDQGARNLNPNEKYRYQISPPEDRYWGSIFFDMDWRNKPHSPSISVLSAVELSWLNQQEKILAKKDRKFSVWLEQQGIAKDDIAEMLHFARYQLSTEEFGVVGTNILTILAAKISSWIKQWLPTTSDSPAGYETDWNLYYTKLAGIVLSGKSDTGAHISSTIGQGLLKKDAITLFHRYQLDAGAWSQKDYDTAEKLRTEFSKIDLIDADGSYGFSMTINKQVLEICQSSFDPDTYKSEEHCNEINIAEFRQ